MIGKLTRVPLREVWKHEAADFTIWLKDNIDVLNEVTELSLSHAEREQEAGIFSVDLVAEDESGETVIIENQLERSDHDHLGKVVTYLTALEAKTAVWIVAEPRPEHVRAISWLNESRLADFYLLKIEAVKIDNSSPAPLLTLIVGPSEEGREVGETKKELKERHILRYHFFSKLLERAKEKTKLHSNISPSYSSWIAAGAGKSGLVFNYVIHEHGTRVELYIDRGEEKREETKAIYDELYLAKDFIHEIFGEPLEPGRLG